jgi:hypothetical protein
MKLNLLSPQELEQDEDDEDMLDAELVDWQGLDTALRQSELARLKNVCIFVEVHHTPENPHEKFERIKSQFPMLNPSGVLDLTVILPIW